ncbi:MAG: hypothetical protein KIT84_01740 [Labilithrix sp.]|nr:hypothetical protein [Labilithrix sp.]MCW5809709.1 hypothetical protein [Labilithrix sp.]
MKLHRSLGPLALIALACCAPAAAPPAKTAPAAPATTSTAASAPATSAAATEEPVKEPEKKEKEPEKKKIELPRGGREIFPRFRLMGYCGTPGGEPAMGRLAGDLAKKAKAIEKLGAQYARERELLPVFELIATIVLGLPGADGKWRRRVPDSVIDQYLKEARAAKALLLLNIQPGHSDFITEVKHYEKYLREPEVGVALDPEWQMHGKQKPGVFYGQTTGTAINEVAEFMAGIIKEGDLPEKALVFHQVNGTVVKDEKDIVPHEGIALIKGVDGLGPAPTKVVTYNYLVKNMPSTTHAGFKLFFDEDTANNNKLMTPDDVMKLTPQPEYIMYE